MAIHHFDSRKDWTHIAMVQWVLMNVRPTLKVSKTSLVFKVEQTRGGSWGRIDDKDKMILRTVIKKMKIGRKTININDKNKPRLQGRANWKGLWGENWKRCLSMIYDGDHIDGYDVGGNDNDDRGVHCSTCRWMAHFTEHATDWRRETRRFGG